MRAMNRLNCWREAVDRLITGPSPNLAKGRALLSFWNTYGLYSIPSGLREDMPHLVDAFRYLLPPYTGSGLTLYRGELDSRRAAGVYGIAWTPRLNTARVFANRRSSDEGYGVVLRIEATPGLIAVAVRDYSPQTLVLDEDEYLVDPRLLKGSVSVIES